MATLLVSYGQTIYDLSLKAYKSLNYVYKILQDNPFITSLDYDFDANPGKSIYYDENFIVPKQPALDLTAASLPSNQSSFKSTYGQSLFDICIQTYGSLEFLYKLIQDNNISGLNTGGVNEKEFTFNTDQITDSVFHNNLKSKGIRINTSFDSFSDVKYRITTDGTLRITKDLTPRITS